MFTRLGFTAVLSGLIVSLVLISSVEGERPKMRDVNEKTSAERIETAESIIGKCVDLYAHCLAYSSEVKMKRIRSYEYAFGVEGSETTHSVTRYQLNFEYRRPRLSQASWMSTPEDRKGKLLWSIAHFNEEYHLSDYKNSSAEAQADPELGKIIKPVNRRCYGVLSLLMQFLDEYEQNDLLENELVLVKRSRARGRKCYVLEASTYTDKRIWIDCETYALRRIEYSPRESTVDKEFAYFCWKTGYSGRLEDLDKDDRPIASKIVRPDSYANIEIIFDFTNQRFE